MIRSFLDTLEKWLSYRTWESKKNINSTWIPIGRYDPETSSMGSSFIPTKLEDRMVYYPIFPSPLDLPLSDRKELLSESHTRPVLSSKRSSSRSHSRYHRPFFIHPRLDINRKLQFIEHPLIIKRPFVEETRGDPYIEVQTVVRNMRSMWFPTSRASNVKGKVFLNLLDTYHGHEINCSWNTEKDSIDIPSSYHGEMMTLFRIHPFTLEISSSIEKRVRVIPRGKYYVHIVVDAEDHEAKEINLGVMDLPFDFLGKHDTYDYWREFCKTDGYVVFLERTKEDKFYANVIGDMPLDRLKKLRDEFKENIEIRKV